VLDSLSNQNFPLLQGKPYNQKFAKYNNDEDKVEKNHSSWPKAIRLDGGSILMTGGGVIERTETSNFLGGVVAGENLWGILYSHRWLN